MKRLILLAVVLLGVSCSKDDDNSNQEKCYVVTEKNRVYENGKYTYYFTLSDYGTKEVSASKYEAINKNESYCFGGAPKY